MTEIKSAYRRLARKLHPDVNKDSKEATADFARVAKAYEILSNPQERAYYDTQILTKSTNGSIHSTDSVFYSDNLHAQKLRQMAIKRRYNEIVDQMMDAERDETLAWQKVIFPIVALFVSTLFIGIFRPSFFEPNFWFSTNIIGKLILVTFFIISALHIAKRLRLGFERYTFTKENLHESIFDDNESNRKPFSRFKAIFFLLFGVILSLGIGYLIGGYLEMTPTSPWSAIFSGSIHPEALLYPPIVVLLVDLMHLIASKLEQHST